jgi:hypothetical protein
VLARLRDARGNMRAWGRDDILAVDWKSDAITGQGAVYEVEPRVERFLKEGKGLDVPAYSPDAGKLDWLVLAGPREAKDMPGMPIPADRVTGPDGHGRGFSATFFRGTDLKEEAGGRVDPTIDFPDGVPALEGMGANNFSVRWEGRIVTPATGAYTFRATADVGMRVWVNGKQLIDDWSENPPRTREGKIDLAAGEPANVKVEFFQAGGGSTMRLLWLPPDTPTLDAGKVWDRVRDDGTTAIVVDHADSWIASLAERGAVKYGGTMRVGIMWLGGQYFVKDHPLFAGLPVNVAMNWPYQDLLGGGWDRYALKVEGEELVAGAWNSSPFSLGTAVGVIPYGKGKVIFCTLPVVDALNATDKAAAVPKKLMVNFLGAR